MIVTDKIALLKVNMTKYKVNGCLIIYQENEFTKEDSFLIFVDDFLKEENVLDRAARITVKTEASKYILNKAFIRDFYDHPVENHIAIFKDKVLVHFTPLEKLEKAYSTMTKNVAK